MTSQSVKWQDHKKQKNAKRLKYDIRQAEEKLMELSGETFEQMSQNS